MARYDYMKAMENDIREYIENDFCEDIAEFDRYELEEKLHDDLWTDDGITGNGSGSYTFCSYTAKEYVTENINLCLDMISAFGIGTAEAGERFLNEDWEWFDVSIRCYCLGEAIGNVLDEMGVE